jgi:small conductance mechanosensitive channel
VIEALTLAAAAADTTSTSSDNEWITRLIESGVVILVFLVVWFLLRRVGARVVKRMSDQALEQDAIEGPERVQRIETLWVVLRMMMFVTLLVALALILLDAWGVSIGPLLAVGSVVGVAVGFGAQDFIKDVIAGFLIVAEDQYGLGDVVKIADVVGKVEAIRLRTTVLRDLDGYVHHVPNGAIRVASNYTQDYGQAVLDIDIDYTADVDNAIAVLTDELTAFAHDPEWSDQMRAEPEVFGVDALGDWSVRLRAVVQVLPESRWGVRREFLRRIKKRFDAEGIEIPFPHLTVVTAAGGGAAAATDPRPEPAPAPSERPAPE